MSVRARNGRQLLFASGALIGQGNGSPRIDFRLTCGRKSLDHCKVTLTWPDGASTRAETLDGVWVPQLYWWGGAHRLQTARLTFRGLDCAQHEMFVDVRGDRAKWNVEYTVTGTKAPCEAGKKVYELHRRPRPMVTTQPAFMGCAPVLIDPDDLD